MGGKGNDELQKVYLEISQKNPWVEDDYGEPGSCYFCGHDYEVLGPIPSETVGVGFGFSLPADVLRAAREAGQIGKHHKYCLFLKAQSRLRELSDAD